MPEYDEQNKTDTVYENGDREGASTRAAAQCGNFSGSRAEFASQIRRQVQLTNLPNVDILDQVSC